MSRARRPLAWVVLVASAAALFLGGALHNGLALALGACAFVAALITITAHIPGGHDA